MVMMGSTGTLERTACNVCFYEQPDVLLSFDPILRRGWWHKTDDNVEPRRVEAFERVNLFELSWTVPSNLCDNFLVSSDGFDGLLGRADLTCLHTLYI